METPEPEPLRLISKSKFPYKNKQIRLLCTKWPIENQKKPGIFDGVVIGQPVKIKKSKLFFIYRMIQF